MNASERHVRNCIAVGYGARSERQYEFVLRVPLGKDPAIHSEMRAVMTPEEWVHIRAVFIRLIASADPADLARAESA